jgi:ABC-type sugar transport system permease subunit
MEATDPATIEAQGKEAPMQDTMGNRTLSSPGKGRRRKSYLRRNTMAYWLILPSLLFLLAIVFYPLVTGLAEGFRYHSRVQPWLTRFNGLENYVTALHDHQVWLALRTSIVMVVGIVGLSYLLGLVSGLLLNKSFRLRGVYRALILVPWVVPPVVSYISWQWMLNDQSGLIDLVLMKMHVVDSPILWLSRPGLAMLSIVVVGVWSRFPFMMITVLAALSSIPDELSESAALDGASRFQTFRYITFPLILPVTVVATLLQAIWTFNDFGLPFILTGGGPANSTTPLILLSYKEAFQRFNIGYGTSLAVISMALMLFLGALYLRMQKRQGVYE